MVSEQVGPNDIAEVVSNWTGIPVGRLLQGESEKLLHMEERLGERLIGQHKAVRTALDAVRRSRAHLRPEPADRLLLFLGPTVWARPSWPSRWRSSCSTTSTRWCGST